MNDNSRVYVEAADNGYVVSYKDPEIVRQNEKGDTWTDPERMVICKKLDEVGAVLAKCLPEVKEKADDGDFVGAFKQAMEVSEDE